MKLGKNLDLNDIIVWTIVTNDAIIKARKQKPNLKYFLI